jgi:small-conductance mechanosensitive channel
VNTVVATPDGEEIVIPNGMLLDAIVRTPARPSQPEAE